VEPVVAGTQITVKSLAPGLWFLPLSIIIFQLVPELYFLRNDKAQSRIVRSRDHASEPGGEGRFELNNSFDQQSHLRYVLAAEWSF